MRHSTLFKPMEYCLCPAIICLTDKVYQNKIRPVQRQQDSQALQLERISIISKGSPKTAQSEESHRRRWRSHLLLVGLRLMSSLPQGGEAWESLVARGNRWHRFWTIMVAFMLLILQLKATTPWRSWYEVFSLKRSTREIVYGVSLLVYLEALWGVQNMKCPPWE